MKPTLTWKDGVCTNPPPEWCVEAISRVDGTWVVWVQQSRSNVVLAAHSIYELPSQQAAQLACEVALWRLGVLPLPGWSGAPDGMMVPHDDALAYIVIPNAWGRIAERYGAWEWRVTVDPYDGRAPLVARGAEIWRERAMAHTETVLRALIAAALEASEDNV